ncbi:hypothetical protein F1737_03265 [Methanoplanus sp. FWC-SCC4]|uniref:Zinc/iron-chelating domain-containing protein n=1 Tax=Methanochimaera problematica TaxID=2609417 RepID=A0AA97I3Z4_9EURY|nr:hypothetical protein [Methanoplanus sp. FWC-SCC4]WOF15781.1 hypothetical protein F1737_03265 [Methanoplanus sp. FWC-SCC4]
MAEFLCTLCGRCCMGMGRYVKITGQMGSGKYAARHEISKETFYATVDRKHRNSFDPFDRSTPVEWCPFLIDADEEGNYYCAVHDSIPGFCRNFKCCSYRIFDRDKNSVGRVKGSFNLISDDNDLKSIWESEIKSLSCNDEEEQKEQMISVLSKKGYFVEEYD